jgi:hypothetical protein
LSSALTEILERLKVLPEDDVSELVKQAAALPIWCPNPGPQTRGYECEADELFYGGEAGGGKTDLAVGLAITAHTNSLILRKYIKDSIAMADRLMDGILQSRDGWNGQMHTYRAPDGKTVDFGGCQYEDEKQRYKGDPHDLIVFDEVSDFSESMYRFIIGWNRTTVPGQRCRVVAAGNPPTTAEGLWIIRYWGAWLDPTHPSPAKEGELRWYTTIDGKDEEVDGPGPHEIPGEPRPVMARSRTFIRARLEDNPDLAQTNYASVLAALPKELRDAYRDGKFDASIRDNPWQVIPTAWVQAAQARWTEHPPVGVPQCAIGVDVAQGGVDNNVLAIRHDGWYAPPIVIPGASTPLGGTDVAGIVVAKRRDGSVVVVDCGGGYGGGVFKHLKENEIKVVAYKGAEASVRRTTDQKLKFANRRAECLWRFREALDPDQQGGSTIMLPPDSEILADLTSPTYEVTSQGIKVETKEKLVARIGRSPDKGDAICMAWSEGDRISSAYGIWKDKSRGTPKVIHSHGSARRRA